MLVHTVCVSLEMDEAFFTALHAFSGNELLLTKRVTDITIELLQNIRRHSDREDASLQITREDSKVTWKSINRVTPDQINPLAERINFINNLGYADLKKQHTRVLAKSRHNRSANAGLGLYRIAMRSQSKLTASFEQLDSGRVIFSLDVNLALHP